MDQIPVFDAELIQRYDRPGPRYTSYPTAVQFHEGFDSKSYKTIARHSNEDPIPRPLSLYFHLPFCDTVCFYCACNKVITKNRSRAAPYLERVHKEIAMHGALYDRDRTVDQLHWGGGTPTFLSHEQMRELMAETRRHFTLHADDSGEYSIEVDPREVREETIALLRELGFNRMSLGVQDIDPQVQVAVNRIQPLEITAKVLETALNEGFRSINLDLIYGLPRQTQETCARTLDAVIALAPSRIALYNYAHLPSLFKTQQQIKVEELPPPVEKLAILKLAIERLSAAGYVYIGMDHFAKPEDELAIAQREGSLYRNFQGYSTHAESDLIGIGVSALSQVGDSYCQNARDLETYTQRIDANEIPIFRGIELKMDDLLRRKVITQLICHFVLETKAVEDRYGIRFDRYFADELGQLAEMEADGLLSISPSRIEITPAGRLLIRNICAVFDRYLRPAEPVQRFSRMV
jgi:oxygen-independent coproporphyrinogen-3 oxidase